MCYRSNYVTINHYFFISQYFPSWFLCFFSNRVLSREVSRLLCHPVMVGHLTHLYLQSKKCTDIIFDILKVALVPFSVVWLVVSFRWYIRTNVSQETTVCIFRVFQEGLEVCYSSCLSFLVQDVPSRGLLFLKTLLKMEVAIAIARLAPTGLHQNT